MDEGTGFVYIISDGEAFKVGVSVDPHERLRQLQTANRKELTLEHYEEKQSPYKVEGFVHRSLAQYRTRGEWFEGLTYENVRSALLLCTEYD